jgi:prophage antirepressor-like protein
MNPLQNFNFHGVGVRVVQIDGEPWFVGKDVCAVLGYTNHSKALSDHCKAAQSDGVTIRDSMGRDQTPTLIPERDVYRLIMRSKLPAAEHFEEWVVGEVLPSIRKTGSYGADPIAALSDPEQLRGLLLTYSEKVMALESENARMAPSVAALERLTLADGSLCITDAAKHLQIRPKDLFAWLSRNRWIYKRSGARHFVGYQDKVQQGLVEHKVTTVTTSDGTERVNEQVRVTPKGLAKLAGVFEAA